MGTPVFAYNGKTISLPKPPEIFFVNPVTPVAINTTLTGVTETIRQARCDVRVHVEWNEASLTAALRVQLENLWQWLKQGNTCTLAFDSAKVVATTLVGIEAAGETSILVTSGTNIINGQNYIIKGGPNYQLVNLTGVAGATLTTGSTLDYSFAAGSQFRDPYFWTLALRDKDARFPIRELPRSKVAGSYDFTLDAYEVAV